MGQRLQISFKELVTGSSFTVKVNTGADIFTLCKIDVVDSSPLQYQVISTKDVEKDKTLQTAQERVIEEIQKSSFVIGVESIDTSIFVEFEDAFDFVLDLQRTSPDANDYFRYVSLIGSLGNRFDSTNEPPYPAGTFESPFLENIRIDEISHQIIDFSGYAARTTNIAANFGNYVETKITFTSADTLTASDSFKFYFGYIEKDTNPYSQPSNYEIDNNLFKDPYQGSVTQFVIDNPSGTGVYEDMSHVAPRWGQYGDAQLQHVGSDEYIISFKHYVPFLPREDDYAVNNYVIPEQVNGGKTLKPIFQIDIIGDKQSNAPEQSTSRVDLSNFFSKGSIGFYDQVFQTGEKLYSLENVIFNNGSNDVDKIDSSRDTKITFDITADDATNFSTDDELIFNIIDVDLLTTEAAKRNDFITNQKYDRALVSANNVPANGSIGRISQFKAQINAVDLDILNCEVTIPKLSVTSFYAIWVAVSCDGVISAQNLYLQSEVAESGGDETVVNMDIYSVSASRVDFNFYPHWQTIESNLSGTFNEVKAFPEDVYACKYRIVNEDSVGTLLQSFSTRIVNRLTGEIYEEFSLNNSDTSATYQRDWYLDQQFQNEVTIQWNKEFEAGKNEILVNHAFKIPENWQDVEGIVLEWSAFYIQTLDDGTVVSFNKINQSPDFQIGIYDQTKNTTLEPQALNNSGTVELFDYTGGVVGDSVSKIQEIEGAKTLVRYTFTDENLGDLQALPSTPIDYTFNISERMDGNLTGYLDLVEGGGTVNEKWRFHNFESNYPSFWESVTGHVDNGFAKVQRTAIDTATIEGVIDGTKFIETFNKSNTCYDFSARLDKVQTNPVAIDVETDIYVFMDSTSFRGENASGKAEERINNWFLDYVRQSRESGNPFLGTLYKVYPQASNFGQSFNYERYIAFPSTMRDNEEPIDFTNANIPYTGFENLTRNMTYKPGLLVAMRAVDISDNTVVKTAEDGVIDPSTLQMYYSSFFDEAGGNLTHLEHDLDFFSTASRTITFNGVSNRTTWVADTVNQQTVQKYIAGGLNGSYDRSFLTFKGWNNDYDYDFGSGVETITPFTKCLFITFIDDLLGGLNQYNQYVLYSAPTLAGCLELNAFNQIDPVGSENCPTWIYKEDYDDYFANVVPNIEKIGSVLFPAQGEFNSGDIRKITLLGATHLDILRALSGSSITLNEMRESTFLRSYDDNDLGQPDQTYNSLTALDVAASGKLFDNTDRVNYNNLSENNFSAVYDYGDYFPSAAMWDSATNYTIGQKVSHSNGFNDYEYTALTNNVNSNPNSNPSDWRLTSGAGFIGGLSQSEFNNKITIAINEIN